MIKRTEEEALRMLDECLSNGTWLPAEVEDMSCSCHITTPCTKCCLDGDYLDEFCQDKNITII